jgi:hypothetical protein
MRLSKEEINKFNGQKPIAYFGYGLWGVEVLDVIYDIDNYIVIKDTQRIYTRKVYECSKGFYIKMYGSRVYLDEIIRIN